MCYNGSVAKKPNKRTVGQHHGDLRQTLLSIALKRLEAPDDDALSLRDIAKEAGVAPAAPYHHFGSREGLLAAIAADGFVRLGETLHAAASADDSDAEALACLVTTYVRFALSRPAHYRLMWSTPAKDGAWPDLEETALLAFQRLKEAMQRVAPQVDDATMIHRAALVWSMAHGFVSLVSDGVIAGLPGVGDHTLVSALGSAAVQIARG
jgi:AcrR family transcriptional regulator